MSAPVIVVFGITGDLSKRYILPALYHTLKEATLPPETTILGLSRHELDEEELLSTVELCVLEKDNVCDPVGMQRFRDSLQTLRVDPTMANDFTALKNKLNELDGQESREHLLYLSVPGNAYETIITNLGHAGINTPNDRLLIEKPFGHDIVSAEALIKHIGQHFREEQVYRIDHYLAKETAQNVLAFRLHNPIFNTIWDSENVARVHVMVSEALTIEGRTNFYEQTGALRDLVQSHVLQLLAITLMDLPTDMSSEAIHRNKQQFMEQILPADPAKAVRGQYQGYKTDVENPHSTIETYAKIHLNHSSERWHNVDIVLETGKALAARSTYITIDFKGHGGQRHNSLTFQIQPDEGIKLDLLVKKPGLDVSMHHTALSLNYGELFKHTERLAAYERVLLDAVRGDQSLFASDREVMASWRVLQPLLDAWNGNGDGLAEYAQGSDGPN